MFKCKEEIVCQHIILIHVLHGVTNIIFLTSLPLNPLISVEEGRTDHDKLVSFILIFCHFFATHNLNK